MGRQSGTGAGGMVLLRAVLSLATLLLLLVALPVALFYGTLALAGPGGLPLVGGAGGAGGPLAGRDQGQLFVWALTLLGWLGWIGFALGVLVEIPARIRGRSARRLPALGWSQRLAAVLLAAVFALFPAVGAFAATPQTAAVTATATFTPATVNRTASAVTTVTTSTSDGNAATDYTVRAARPAETLWTIAAARLGGGERWQQIAALNEGRVIDADGTVFHADLALRPGWRLRMPPAPAAAPAAAPVAAPTVAVTVRAGDTLSGIAEAHRVAGGWQSVYAANRAVIGADPDLIAIGEHLTLPGRPAAAATNPAPAVRSARTPDVVDPPGIPVPAIPVPASTPTSPPVHAPRHAAPQSALTAPAPAIGAAGLLAAGLVGALVRNRIRQQRRRPPRGRIPMPSLDEQLYETFLRAMADPTGLDLLDRTLRTLGMTCLDTGAELPALAAVALRPGGIVDLHLREPAAAAAPFAGSPDGMVWRCHAPEAKLLDVEQARDVPAPYPALVTLGRTLDGVHVLVDLESVRHLSLDGTPEQVAGVTRALVAELAASPLTDHLRVLAHGSSAPLVGLLFDATGSDRLDAADDPTRALAELTGHRRKLERALAECAVPYPRAARSQGVAVDLWSPLLLCTDQQLTQDQRDRLTVVLAGTEPGCVAAVTPWSEPGESLYATDGDGSGLRLDARPGHFRISADLPFTVELQRLDEAEFASALHLLTVSQQPASEPAPDWTGHDPDEPVDLDDPFVIPVLAIRSAATGGATAASATAVPLLAPNTPGAVSTRPAQPQPAQPHPGRPRPDQPQPDRHSGLLPALSSGLKSRPATTPAVPRAPDRDWTLPPRALPPRILLLGPVRVLGAAADGVPSGAIRTSQLTALTALLAAHPDPDPRLIDAVLDPVPYATARPASAARGAVGARADALQRLRAWLGAAPDGTPWVAPSSWRLHSAVTCDWTDFQVLYRDGMNARGPAEDAALRRALDLVRGGPFAGAHQLYPWAEPFRQDMISAVIDAAHELAKRCLAAGDLAGCEAALRQGLAAVPEAEILHRGLIRLYATNGRGDGVAATITRLAQVNDALGCLDYEPETLELFSLISGRRRP